MKSRVQRIGLAVLLLGLFSVANAQDNGANKDDREEIYLSVNVGYNTAYREKSWVPVDVIIRNEQADLEGMIEVRTYDHGNRLQSPIYHLPVSCPKDSNKHFRMMAYVDGAMRLEAVVLENGRPAIDTPSYIKITPIDPEDMMGIILDDDPLNYAFLNLALQQRNNNVRLHRYTLGTKELAFLPSHIKAYDAFDFIIIGSIDPSRVSPQHRELLQQYVESGGVVIITAGLNGNRFKGTWIEALAGVKLGASENVNEQEVAQTLFPDPKGSEARNEITLTELTRSDSPVQFSSAEHLLASKRSLGAGTVYTLAVDAESHAFQGMHAYRSLWGKMISDKATEHPLNADFFTSSAAQMIPNLSGITVRSLSFVVMYLMLYVGIAIIGNWLFWNYRKRREMAWVCLVVFSISFSAYAYVSGTAGWAKSSEKQQIDVVHIKPGVTHSDYYGLTGILTARTRNYSAKQQGTDFLMKDISSVVNPYNNYQNRRERTPFIFVQGDEPGMTRFTVGASELRFAALEGKLEGVGTFEGTLELRDEGIQGTFSNQTSFTLNEAALLYKGVLHPLRRDGDELKIDLTWSELEAQFGQTLNSGVNNNNFLYYYNNRGEQETFQALRRALFMDERDQLLPRNYLPTIVGWSEGLAADPLLPDHEMIDKLHKTLVVAQVPVKNLRTAFQENALEENLLVRVGGGNSTAAVTMEMQVTGK